MNRTKIDIESESTQREEFNEMLFYLVDNFYGRIIHSTKQKKNPQIYLFQSKITFSSLQLLSGNESHKSSYILRENTLWRI